MVFIGLRMDREKLTRELNACLLTDVELSRGRPLGRNSQRRSANGGSSRRTRRSPIGRNTNQSPERDDGKKTRTGNLTKQLAGDGYNVSCCTFT
ncbi:hypothetical protein [Zavarzinella formosa]